MMSIELLREDDGTSNSGRLSSSGCLSSLKLPSLFLELMEAASALIDDDKSWGLKAGETKVSSIVVHDLWLL